jgi:SAM-dependent methyltransferase
MIDERARRGFAAAELYDMHRPSYPPAAVAFVRERAGLDGRSTVVDLAAGTGIMTRLLPPVGRLIAIEPLAEMREILRARVPEAEIIAAAAEDIPLPSESVDAVVVAQAFHWFANAQALGEIARILKPDGVLALVWNEDDLSDPFMEAFDAALRPYRLRTPRFAVTPWRDVLRADDSPLAVTDQRTYTFEEPLTLGHLQARVLTYSYIALLDARTRGVVRRKLEKVVSRALGAPATNDTKITLRHVTEVFIARLRPTP